MTKIEAGDKAIEFNTADYLGNIVRLGDYKGKKVLLSFFRGASCPFCNLRVNQLINRYAEFEQKKIEVIAFFGASQKQIAEYAGKQNPPFSIIPDSNLDVYRRYGIEESNSGMVKALLKPIKMMKVMTSGYFNLKSVKDKPLIPADFLIDESQIIYRTFYGKDFGDHLPTEDILGWRK